VYEHYTAKTAKFRGDVRIPLPPFKEMAQGVVKELLDPQRGMAFPGRAALRTQLGMPAESAPAPEPEASAPLPTNAVPVNATNGQPAGV